MLYIISSFENSVDHDHVAQDGHFSYPHSESILKIAPLDYKSIQALLENEKHDVWLYTQYNHLTKPQ